MTSFDFSLYFYAIFCLPSFLFFLLFLNFILYFSFLILYLLPCSLYSHHLFLFYFLFPTIFSTCIFFHVVFLMLPLFLLPRIFLLFTLCICFLFLFLPPNYFSNPVLCFRYFDFPLPTMSSSSFYTPLFLFSLETVSVFFFQNLL